MKRLAFSSTMAWRALMAAVTMSLLATGAPAEERKVNGMLNVGVAASLQPPVFQENWPWGVNIGVGVGVKPVPIATFTLSLDWFYFFTDKGSGARAIDDVNVQYAPLGARIHPFDSVVPYFAAGFGWFRIEQEDALGIHAGIGVEFSLVYVEILYINGFTADESTGLVPVRVGIIF